MKMENIKDEYEPAGLNTIYFKEERIPPDEEIGENVKVQATDDITDLLQLINEDCNSVSKESNVEISASALCVDQGLEESEKCKELSSLDPLSITIGSSSATTPSSSKSGKPFSTKQHRKIRYSIKHFKCGSCDKLFPIKSQYNSHVKVCTLQDMILENFINRMQKKRTERELNSIHSKEERIPCDDEIGENVKVVDNSDHLQLNEDCDSVSKESNIESSTPALCIQQEQESEKSKEHNSLEPLSITIGSSSSTSCDKLLSSKQHTKIHKPVEPFKCKICDKLFPNKTFYNTHVKLCTSQENILQNFIKKIEKNRTEIGEKQKEEENREREEKMREIEVTKRKRKIQREKERRKNDEKRRVREEKLEEIEKKKEYFTDESRNKQQFECNFCNTWFSTEETFVVHVSSHTGEKPYKCDLCDKHFLRKRSLQYHIDAHVGKKSYICEFCGETFVLKRFLNAHLRCHTGEEYKCEFCNRTFSLASNFSEHMRVHSGNLYKCEYCDKTFTKKRYLIPHIRAHTGDLFKCEYCDKTFTHACYLNYHVRDHTGQSPFVCDICNKSFSLKSKLRIHMMTHTVEQQECEICFKLIKKSTLVAHMRYHMKPYKGISGEKPYKCNHCDKSFRYISNFNFHKRSNCHSGEKISYKCVQCGKSLTSKAILKHHMMRHTGEKPHKCDQCPKRFLKKTSLSEHLRYHSGDFYKCDNCGKSFLQKGNLIAHIKLHRGERPYKCNFCNRSYSRKSNLLAHVKIHSEEKL